jgi:predicted O-methyltransferase YrrM
MLRQLIQEQQPKVIVELGSWLGLCTAFLLEQSASGGAAVFAIDRWDAALLLREPIAC